jgi:hypothetical protein
MIRIKRNDTIDEAALGLLPFSFDPLFRAEDKIIRLQHTPVCVPGKPVGWD